MVLRNLLRCGGLSLTLIGASLYVFVGTSPADDAATRQDPEGVVRLSDQSKREFVQRAAFEDFDGTNNVTPAGCSCTACEANRNTNRLGCTATAANPNCIPRGPLAKGACANGSCTATANGNCGCSNCGPNGPCAKGACPNGMCTGKNGSCTATANGGCGCSNCGPNGPGATGACPKGACPFKNPDGSCGCSNCGPDGTAGKGVGPNGISSKALNPNGVAPNGMSPNGNSPKLLNPAGAVPNGIGSKEISPNGVGPNGVSPNGVGPNGAKLSGAKPNGVGPSGVNSKSLSPNGVSSQGAVSANDGSSNANSGSVPHRIPSGQPAGVASTLGAASGVPATAPRPAPAAAYDGSDPCNGKRMYGHGSHMRPEVESYTVREFNRDVFGYRPNNNAKWAAQNQNQNRCQAHNTPMCRQCQGFMVGQWNGFVGRNHQAGDIICAHLQGKMAYFHPMGNCGEGVPYCGHYDMVYAADPNYADPRDTGLYAAQGYGVPIAVPLAPNVRHTMNYSSGMPASRLTPISNVVPPRRCP